MSEEFLAHRRMLLGLAYRLLGTVHDAEDVIQDAYLRWTRADRSEVAEPVRTGVPGAAEHTRLREGFVAAARDGDVERLEELLHEDVIAWNDGGGKVRTGPNPIRGRAKVVRFFVSTMRHRTKAPDAAIADVPAAERTESAHPGPFVAVPTGVNGQYALLVGAGFRYTMCVCVVDGRIQDLFRIANPAKLSTFGGGGS